MKRFKEFKNNIQDLHEEKLLSDPEYYAECLLEQVEESGNSPFGGDELPASPSGQDLWSKGLEGASGNSRPKYWKNFIKIEYYLSYLISLVTLLSVHQIFCQP